MDLTKLRSLWLSIAALTVIIAWGVVIWLACYVSQIIINSLETIVKLAGISPG